MKKSLHLPAIMIPCKMRMLLSLYGIPELLRDEGWWYGMDEEIENLRGYIMENALCPKCKSKLKCTSKEAGMLFCPKCKRFVEEIIIPEEHIFALINLMKVVGERVMNEIIKGNIKVVIEK